MSECTQCGGEGCWEEDVFSPSLGHGTVPRQCLHCEGTGEEPEPPERCWYPDDVRREAMRRFIRRGRGWGMRALNAECFKVVREREADRAWKVECGLWAEAFAKAVKEQPKPYATRDGGDVLWIERMDTAQAATALHCYLIAEDAA